MKSFRHAPGGHFRQNLDPLQVTLAHLNQSHPQSPPSLKPGESDIVTLQSFALEQGDLCKCSALCQPSKEAIWSGQRFHVFIMTSLEHRYDIT
ncbi:hypothetical protein [Rhizobium azibense]|uniref:Uncharacterized protein n=1 Tax=Rhizobium azibense TaxID=1136135 RepID=A0A4R3REV6_9HYPH|nr:hypothetical protein [Rhizobium azibense]TCU33501.1 hypothetical protein EV129_1156 [Rhizobium azibense]